MPAIFVHASAFDTAHPGTFRYHLFFSSFATKREYQRLLGGYTDGLRLVVSKFVTEATQELIESIDAAVGRANKATAMNKSPWGIEQELLGELYRHDFERDRKRDLAANRLLRL